MKVQLSPKEDMELSKGNISKVIASLDLQGFTEKNRAVRNILKNIVNELARIVLNLDELEYASLHARNIFELYLILTHVYSDENAMRNWYGQIHKDSEQVRNGFRMLLVKKGLDTSSLDEVKEFEDRALENSPYSSERNFVIRDLAIAHGYKDDYDFVYKLSSKLIHPSSLKVNFYDIMTENDKYLKVIIPIAMHFGQKAEKLAQEIGAEIA